jgi:hypothetical protein
MPSIFWRNMSMANIEFKATLQMLVPMIIQVIIEKKDLPVISAVKLLYLSKLYEKLEIESTKLWHLSPLALYELLEIEQQTGKLIFPTEA